MQLSDVYAQWWGVVADGDGVGGGSKDQNTARLMEMRKWLLDKPGKRIHFPAGILCVTNAYWALGIDAHFDFTGVTGQQLGAVNIPFAIFGGGDPSIDISFTTGLERARMLPDFIDTVAAGLASVVLKVASDVSRYTVGRWVQISGYEQQGGGFPNNYRYVEYARIKAVLPAENRILLDRALQHEYREDWYFQDAACCWEATSAQNLIGPAGIQPLYREGYYSFVENVRVDNLTTIPHPGDVAETNPSYPGAAWHKSSAVWANGAKGFQGNNIKTSLTYVGVGGDYRWRDCVWDFLEPDKQASSLEIDQCRVGVLVQATGFERVTVRDTKVDYAFGLYPRRLLVERCELPVVCSTTPSGWNMTRADWRNNRFHVQSPEKELFGGLATGLDALAPFSCVALTADASQFTTDATVDDYALRIRMATGTVLRTSSGARAVVTGIAMTPDRAHFVISYTGTTITAGDRLYFYNLNHLSAVGNERINGSQGVPQNQQWEPAEHYDNISDGVTAITMDVVWSEFLAGSVQFQTIDGCIDEIAVNVIKPYTGTDGSRLIIAPYLPASPFSPIVINTALVGQRHISIQGAIGALNGDVLSVPGQNYVRSVTLQVLGVDNTSWRGNVRFKVTKRK